MIESPDIVIRLRNLIEDTGGLLTLFDRTLLQRSRILELIDVLVESLPEELELAKEIIEKKEQILQEARQQAGEILDESVRRAERLIDTDAVTFEAREKSKEIKVQTDNYVVERLILLEGELNRLLDEVRGGITAMGSREGVTGIGENNGDVLT